MDKKKIIAIVGATGAQGGSLAHAILNDNNSEFTVRALTRDVNSDKAKNLAKLGAEVVMANVDDIESLKPAFEGVYGAFCVTFFWEHFSPEKEKQHAKNMAEAAKYADVKHVIWSSLDDTRKWVPLDDDRMPTLMGNYKVPHFDAKGESNSYFTDLGLPVTILNTCFYWENMIYFGMGPKKGPDGKLLFTLPMGEAKLPSISAEDIGKCAYGIFKQGSKYINRTVGIAGEHLTGTQFANSLSRALGKEVVYNAVEPEVYRGFNFPGAEDLGNMFQFNRDFAEDYCATRDLNVSRSLNPSLQDFDSWLVKNKELIPLD